MTIKGMGGLFAGQEFQVNGSLVFGRNPQGCNVNFPDNTKGVSRMHCKVDIAGGSLTLTDMGSSYGTYLNGRKLTPYSPAALNPGDMFWLGDRANSFSVGGVAVSSPVVNNPGGAVTMQNPRSADKNKMMIGAVAAALVILILVIVIINQNSKISDQKNTINSQETQLSEQQDQINSQENQLYQQQNEINSQQQQIDNFNNRGPLERIVDGVGGAFELFGK